MENTLEQLAGWFLVVDGGDGGGKTTQIQFLAEAAREAGLEVVLTRDPGGTPIGDAIRELLLHRSNLGEADMARECELLLFMASRAQLAAEVIRPALQRGACVICDRWVSATIAYQTDGSPEQIAAVERAAEVAVSGLKPDLTLILDLPVEVGLERARGEGSGDRIESRTRDYHEQVRRGFLDQAGRHPERFSIIDASSSIEDVHGRIRNALAARLAGGSPC